MSAKNEPVNKHLAWVERITHLMDSQFRIPGTDFRFGLDPLIGLVPFLGDAVSLAVSGLLVSSLWRYGASGEVKARLIVNVLLDFTLGAIPVVGSIFDFFFKANERNLKLVKAHFTEGRYHGNSKGFIIRTVLILSTVLAFALYGVLKFSLWLVDVLGNMLGG